MKLTLIAATIVVALATPQIATATYTTIGESDCGEWIASPMPHRKAWLLGFMSGFAASYYAVRGDDPLAKASSAQQIYVWMDNYCRANPLQHVSDGAQILFAELIKKTDK